MTNSEHSSYITCREFIDRAIEFERDSASFYRALREQVEPGPVCQLLKLLEDQETQHALKLQEWTPPEPEAMMQFPPNLSANTRELPESPVSLSQLIEMAIERERIAKESYLSAARYVTGGFRALVEALAVFEEEHEQKLRSMRNI